MFFVVNLLSVNSYLYHKIFFKKKKKNKFKVKHQRQSTSFGYKVNKDVLDNNRPNWPQPRTDDEVKEATHCCCCCLVVELVTVVERPLLLAKQSTNVYQRWCCCCCTDGNVPLTRDWVAELDKCDGVRRLLQPKRLINERYADAMKDWAADGGADTMENSTAHYHHQQLKMSRRAQTMRGSCGCADVGVILPMTWIFCRNNDPPKSNCKRTDVTTPLDQRLTTWRSSTVLTSTWTNSTTMTPSSNS